MPDKNDLRSTALWTWFVSLCQSRALGTPRGDIEPVSGDASFRRYFRGVTEQGSWILVDAPVDREDSRPFLAVQVTLAAQGVQVPKVVAADLVKGFMCLQDFGSELLLGRLTTLQATGDEKNQGFSAATDLYQQAFAELLKIQQCDPLNPALPLFDRAMLLREMQLFTDWLCKGLLQLELTSAENSMISAAHEILIDSALGQQQVYVHRDFHSRNLMLLESGLGVIDFQDAVTGPCTYDLVSLLKDCYINWPAVQVSQWALDYLHAAQNSGILPAMDNAQFLTEFNLMGVQRHLKAAGIFCRLWLRDGKAGYLHDIPRTLSYISEQNFTDSALQQFAQWLSQKILPMFNAHLYKLDNANSESAAAIGTTGWLP